MPATHNDLVLATHPSELFMAMDMAFPGDDWLEWEPETLVMSYRWGDLSDQAVDKILAVHAVASNTSLVLADSIAFEKVVTAFCNNVCVMDASQPPYVEEILYAVRQIRLIAKLAHPTDGDKIVFHSAVPSYIAAVAKFRDWFVLPDELEFAQASLNYLTSLPAESKLRKEHAEIIDAVEEVYKKLGTKDAEAMLENGDVRKLSGDDAASMLARRLIGALLYDPTLPYKKQS